MSRSYTNRDGVRVEVTNEHLDTAILIKNELQKSSPSGRCSWAKHKRMMEAEGYDDSENSESYRQLIKAEQSARGILPTVEKYADMVVTSKIEAIKTEIGEISLAKRDAQNSFRELNKLKRELSDGVLLAESIENVMKEKDFGKPAKFEPVYVDRLPKKDMIVCLSDVHYGAVVDVEGRYYNVNVAEQLIMEYADVILDIVEKDNVEEVHVVNLGDLVEGVYMRTQNAYSSERTFSEQVTDVSELIIKFLQKLSIFVKVKYSGINGNHDRVSSKDDNLYSDGAVSISNKIIETFAKYSGNNNVTYINSEPYHHIVNVSGRSFLFVHGDKTPLVRKSILSELSTVYGIPFDAVVGGHIHHHTINEVSDDKYVVTFGSIKGSDEYTLKTINTSASRSQGVILIDKIGKFEIRQIKLRG